MTRSEVSQYYTLSQNDNNTSILIQDDFDNGRPLRGPIPDPDDFINDVKEIFAGNRYIVEKWDAISLDLFYWMNENAVELGYTKGTWARLAEFWKRQWKKIFSVFGGM